VIVNDFDVMAMAVAPNETNPPLIVDPYRVLPFPISAQGFQLIPGRRRQDSQFRRGMQLQQFPQRHSLESTEPPRMLIVKELLGFRGRKALNHTQNILRVTFYVKDTRQVHPRVPQPLVQRLRVLTFPPAMSPLVLTHGKEFSR
jgi:hypothetical protein